jgi:hypothetical protein
MVIAQTVGRASTELLKVTGMRIHPLANCALTASTQLVLELRVPLHVFLAHTCTFRAREAVILQTVSTQRAAPTSPSYPSASVMPTVGRAKVVGLVRTKRANACTPLWVQLVQNARTDLREQLVSATAVVWDDAKSRMAALLANV